MELKNNPNPPQVRFIRKNGRIIPIVAGKYSSKANSALNRTLTGMKNDVAQASEGKRLITGYGKDQKVISTASSFPTWYKNVGAKNKQHFLGALNTRTGKVYERTVEEAAESLDFKIASRQVFDNTYVSFRKLDGKVRPIRSKNQEQYDYHNKKSFNVNGKKLTFHQYYKQEMGK